MYTETPGCSDHRRPEKVPGCLRALCGGHAAVLASDRAYQSWLHQRLHVSVQFCLLQEPQVQSGRTISDSERKIKGCHVTWSVLEILFGQHGDGPGGMTTRPFGLT